MKRVVVPLLVLLAITAPSIATIAPVGGVVKSQSWAQRFEESGVGNFDLVAVRMVSAGDSFETATHLNFTDGSWALSYEDTPPAPLLASASGLAVTYLQWDIKFTGDSSNPLNFDFVAFNGNTIVDCANADWSGGGWNITAGTWNPARAELTPEPATMCLLGLGALALRRRK